jgi:hypothetical protein
VTASSQSQQHTGDPLRIEIRAGRVVFEAFSFILLAFRNWPFSPSVDAEGNWYQARMPSSDASCHTPQF